MTPSGPPTRFYGDKLWPIDNLRADLLGATTNRCNCNSVKSAALVKHMNCDGEIICVRHRHLTNHWCRRPRAASPRGSSLAYIGIHWEHNWRPTVAYVGIHWDTLGYIGRVTGDQLWHTLWYIGWPEQPTSCQECDLATNNVNAPLQEPLQHQTLVQSNEAMH